MKPLFKKEEYLKVLAREPKTIEALTEKLTDQKNLKAFFTNFQETTGFLNTLLIKPDGTIIFSLKDPKKLSINIKKEPYVAMSLAHSFNRSILTMTPDVASFSFDMILRSPTLYSTIPVFSNDKKFIGVVGVQLDMREIFALTDNYFNLGKTGDVILAQAIAQGAQIIAPTRHNPESAFHIIEFQSGQAISPIENAVKGRQGSSIALSYRGNKVVAAWSYIPSLAWGLAITMDLTEARTPIDNALMLFHLSLAAIAILLIAILINERLAIKNWVQRHIAIDSINIALCVVIALTIIAFATIGYYYFYLKNSAINNAQTIAHKKIDDISQKLGKEVENIIDRASYIAQDLTAGRLHKKDIEIRMERDIKENTFLYGLIVAYTPHAYDKGTPLYAPHMIKAKGAVTKEFIDKTFDYTKLTTLANSESNWYQVGMKNEAKWLKPTHDSLSKKLVAQYVVPFYATDDTKKSSPIGVVVAEFALDSLPVFAQKINIGQTSYSFMVTKGGSFIYHPNSQLISSKETIFNYAQKANNKKLYSLATTIIKRESGSSSFTDPVTYQTNWIHYTSIPKSPWSIGLIFLQDEVEIPSKTVRHIFTGLITTIIVMLLCLMLLLCRLIILNHRNQYIAIYSSLILLAGIGMLWTAMRKTIAENTLSTNDIIIGNQASLTAFVDIQKQKAATKFKKFITIPTGILIHAINFPNEEYVTINGYIWQQYNRSSGIEQKVIIPGAKELQLEKVQEQRVGDSVIIGWKVAATIPQKFLLDQYPFDHRRIVIPIAHPIEKVSILLIPNFSGYESFYKTRYLGITKAFSISEFELQNSYFIYKPIEQQVSLIESSAEESLELHYVIQMIRRTLNAFIIYFIPLLVILFTLFATIAFTKPTDTITSVAIIPYTAPLFALIILHGNLRRTYNIGGILYIEYLFFLTYLTILMAVSFNILISRKELMPTDRLTILSKLINIFFWPGQFALWYFATIIAFY